MNIFSLKDRLLYESCKEPKSILTLSLLWCLSHLKWNEELWFYGLLCWFYDIWLWWTRRCFGVFVTLFIKFIEFLDSLTFAHFTNNSWNAQRENTNKKKRFRKNDIPRSVILVSLHHTLFVCWHVSYSSQNTIVCVEAVDIINENNHKMSCHHTYSIIFIDR